MHVAVLSGAKQYGNNQVSMTGKNHNHRRRPIAPWGDIEHRQPHSSMNLLSNSYTMGCPPVRGDNPRALASGLSYVQVDKHGIINLYHLHECRRCTSRDI